MVILNEMIHSARIVPLDGRPHIGTNIRQWSGDSRGRWDGNTLVVDTVNFGSTTSRPASSTNTLRTGRRTLSSTYTRGRSLIRSRMRSGDRSGRPIASTGSKNVCSS